MAWLLLYFALAAAGPPAPPPDSDFRIDDFRIDDFRIVSETPERGVYELRATETFDARADVLAVVLRGTKCRQGCDYEVAHLVEDVVLERATDSGGARTVSRTVTFSRIDSVLAASYFTVSEHRTEPGRVVHEFETAGEDVIQRWSTDERRHDPLFHWQRGRWTLTEEFDAGGAFRHTEVRYEMEMRSDRFLVNLMPGRVLAGSADHVRTLFGYLRALEGHRISAPR